MASHILWLCCRYSSEQRVQLEQSRPRAHHHDLVSETRRYAESSLPGAPWRSLGWRVLRDQFHAAGLRPEDTDANASSAGHVVAAVLVGRCWPYKGVMHRLGAEAHFVHQLNCVSAGVFLSVLGVAALQARGFES